MFKVVFYRDARGNEQAIRNMNDFKERTKK